MQRSAKSQLGLWIGFAAALLIGAYRVILDNPPRVSLYLFLAAHLLMILCLDALERQRKS